MHGASRWHLELTSPGAATTITTGAETETLVGLQGDSVMRVLRVSDSPISMYRGFEIGMAQSGLPLAPQARARWAEPRAAGCSSVDLWSDSQESVSCLLLYTGIRIICAAKSDD